MERYRHYDEYGWRETRYRYRGSNLTLVVELHNGRICSCTRITHNEQGKVQGGYERDKEDGRFRYSYEYDANGNIVRVRTSSRDLNEVPTQTETVTRYDVENRMILMECRLGNAEHPYIRSKYVYDESGLKVTEQYFTSGTGRNSGLVWRAQITREYDEYGIITRELDQGVTAGCVEPKGRETVFYTKYL